MYIRENNSKPPGIRKALDWYQSFVLVLLPKNNTRKNTVRPDQPPRSHLQPCLSSHPLFTP